MTDTRQPIVVAPTPTAIAPSRKHRWWAGPLAAIAITVLVVITVATVVTASRFGSIKRPYARVPSDAEAVEPHLGFDGVERYPADGRLLFVTIRSPQLSVLSWFMFRHEADILPQTYTDLFGTSTREQQTQRGQLQMRTAQQSAEYAALTKLGYPIDLVPGDVIIDQIVCLKANDAGTACAEEAPSGEVLQANDKLVSVDGKPIDIVDDLTPILAAHKPGDMIEVEYERPGTDGVQTGTIELIASPDDAERTIIGFYPFDTTTVGSAPFDIQFNLNDVGGPSAGLAFTLTIIDELTPGELTGGKRVAVTGEIDIEGKVGAIGGLAQKASAVKQTGTKYFIVPASQSEESLAEARAIVGDDVQIITVSTLDEALDALAKLGGNADDIGQPGKDFEPGS